MPKSLLKKVFFVSSSVLSLIFLLFINVKLTMKSGSTTFKPSPLGFFEFISDSSKANMFGFTRAFMWIGFVLMLLSVIYFIAILILELLKQNRILEKLSLVTKIVSIILITSTVTLLIAGLGRETINKDIVYHVTLFGFPWVMSLIFSIVPIVSEYLIKE